MTGPRNNSFGTIPRYTRVSPRSVRTTTTVRLRLSPLGNGPLRVVSRASPLFMTTCTTVCSLFCIRTSGPEVYRLTSEILLSVGTSLRTNTCPLDFTGLNRTFASVYT